MRIRREEGRGNFDDVLVGGVQGFGPSSTAFEVFGKSYFLLFYKLTVVCVWQPPRVPTLQS